MRVAAPAEHAVLADPDRLAVVLDHVRSALGVGEGEGVTPRARAAPREVEVVVAGIDAGRGVHRHCLPSWSAHRIGALWPARAIGVILAARNAGCNRPKPGGVVGDIGRQGRGDHGRGSGMAKASVKVFVREGAKVVAADISGAEKDTAAEVGGDVLPVHCDVTKEADVEAMIRAAVDEFGRLDVVCNVAGIAEAHADRRHHHGALRQRRWTSTSRRGLRHEARHPGHARSTATAAPSSTGRRSVASAASPYTSVYSAAKARRDRA